MQETRILIAEDEVIARENLAHTLSKLGAHITSVETGNDALFSLDEHEFDVVLTDLKMPDIDGIELLHHIKNTSPDTEVIVLTGYATVDSAVDAMDKGAFRYIAKPIRLDEVSLYVQQALEKKRLKEEVRNLRENLTKGTDSIIGHSQCIASLKQQIDQIAHVGCTVLIQGETGTGKELVAKALHVGSPQSDKKFVAVNCASFSEELLTNELFGHEKSAFTGAGSVKKGLFEVAHGGTFFLDEIGEMPINMQANLLRVLETQKILRVGGTTEIPVDVRVMAATNRNLLEMVEQGTFRQDLYYRLNIITLEIPPLNQRIDDIPLLASFFANKFATLFNKQITEIDDEVLNTLTQYSFPGNVRELENLMQRAVVLCNGKSIRSAHLPPDLQQTFVKRPEPQASTQIITLEENERNHLRRVLKHTKGNKSHAAKLLGLNRGSLWRKMKRFDLAEQ